MDSIKHFLIIIGVAALAAMPIVVSYRIGFHRGTRRAQTVTERDTLYINRVDTIRLTQPRYVTIHNIDTVGIPVFIHEHDTVFVPVPIQQAYYKDSTYEAWVSGYRPKLDSINVFRRLERMTIHTVSEVKTKARWGIGVQAGYGIDRSGLSPYIGVGISYDLISF